MHYEYGKRSHAVSLSFSLSLLSEINYGNSNLYMAIIYIIFIIDIVVSKAEVLDMTSENTIKCDSCSM